MQTRKWTPKVKPLCQKHRIPKTDNEYCMKCYEEMDTGYVEDTTNADLDREAARSLTYSPEIAKAQTRNIEPWYLMEDE